MSVHRLVQAINREELGQAEGARWADAAVRLLNAAFSDVEVQNWPTYASLLPHALATCGHAEALQVGAIPSGRLLNQTGFYLTARAQFTDAQPCYERALGISEQMLGQDHPNTATSRDNLGSLLHDQGDLIGARPSMSAPWPSVSRCSAQTTRTPPTA